MSTTTAVQPRAAAPNSPASAARRVLAAACMLGVVTVPAGANGLSSAEAIQQELRTFRVLGTVLHIAAHPDDENTQLLTYLARGRGYRTAYLSVTRGDGGQNLIGPEFDEKLGVARTQELLAARRLDGARQFFTRAIDFGYSKSPEETLATWDRQAVLSDVVRVIRTFQPDVIVTRFSPRGGGHGHHTASAILAVEAFKLAGDPQAFPEQLAPGLTAWQPKRLLQNGGGGGRGGGTAAPAADSFSIEVGGTDPVLGETFSVIAARSRAMHITQGFGAFAGRGGAGPRSESFLLLDGEPAANDLMDGIDTTWARIPGGGEIARLADELLAQFDPATPAASVPALLALRARVIALPADDVLVREKRAQLDRILQACLGLAVETTIARAEVVAGESLALHHTATTRADVPVRWVAVRYPLAKTETTIGAPLRAGEISTRDGSPALPADTPTSGPYWLREDGSAGIAHVADPRLIGLPENPPAFPVEQIFEIGGQTVVIPDEPVQVTPAAPAEHVRRRLEVIPPVSLAFADPVAVLAPGATRDVVVEVTAARANLRGTLQLELPAGWRATPATQSFALAAAGDTARVSFALTGPGGTATATIGAVATVGGAQSRTGRFELRYEHIPVQLLQPLARLHATTVELAIRGQHVGYLPGAGDDTARSLVRMGYTVTELAGNDCTPEKLRAFDAVVVGVRAYNTREDLATVLPALFAYVEAGGTVVTQYNRPNSLRTETFAPYNLRLSNDRVTDQNAAMTFLAPDHPVLNVPNRITADDFVGWVQERGVYFPNQWDEANFTPILASADPGEPPHRGSLLVARHGRGWFVYTGLAFFRQLPEGVPGAYRLLANLVSLGK